MEAPTLLETTAIEEFYSNFSKKLAEIKETLNSPLTYAEKVIFTHYAGEVSELKSIIEGDTPIDLKVDRIGLQDATAQMAILQFMLVGADKTEVPTSIHADHLIEGNKGRAIDLEAALKSNKEVYNFLSTAANRHGMDFWGPNSGIIHQILLEKYGVPGQLFITTDSHGPNIGGLATLGIGVGGAEAVSVMLGEYLEIIMPKIYNIELVGNLNPFSSPKDIELAVLKNLGVAGGTGFVLEYTGEGVKELSATGKATMTNLGTETGATSSVFPYDQRISTYLRATGREKIAELSDKLASELKSDPGARYSKKLEIDLSKLEPMIAGPHSPDAVHSISEFVQYVRFEKVPELKQVMIGSCTNSSYEDISKAFELAKLAVEKGIKVKTGLMISPGSEQIYQTMKDEGMIEVFESIGATILTNSCGPCIGKWKRTDNPDKLPNSIFTTYNRNFKARNDKNPNTQTFLGSPEMAMAFALAGRLDFNPLTDQLQDTKGEYFSLVLPKVNDVPRNGFKLDYTGYKAPNGQGEVIIDPNSTRIKRLEPFKPWDYENDFNDLKVLFKVEGKCTTDSISPGGSWLNFRGNLEKICENLLLNAKNAFFKLAGKKVYTGKAANQDTGYCGTPYEVAQQYKENGKGLIIIGDINYGEGSSREHAAMEPRYLGCRAVIAKSFARIHETNLKQQGILALRFSNISDYDRVMADDQLTILDPMVEPGKQIHVHTRHEDGSTEIIPTIHTFTPKQIEWYKAGSLVNYKRAQLNPQTNP